MWNAVLLRTYVEDPDVAHRYPVTAENAHFGIDNHSAEFAQFHAAPGPAKGAV
jgi:hypothetical protein